MGSPDCVYWNWLLGKAGRRADADDRLDRYGGDIMANRDVLVFTRRIAGASICGPVLTVTFLAFQQGAISTVTRLMLSEIFPFRLHGLGVITVFCLWGVNFAVSFIFPILLAAAFFIFVVLSICSILFVKTFLPETKRILLEQLEENFRIYKRGETKKESGAEAIG